MYYFEVHPDLLKEKEATTYGAIAKQHKDYYEHTFKSKVKYREMFAVKPFNEINNKSYLLKIKIVNKIIEFWDIGAGGIYCAANEYKKDNPIAMDFDSFNGNSELFNSMHPYAKLIREIKSTVAARQDVVIENSSIEDALKIFVKQT